MPGTEPTRAGGRRGRLGALALVLVCEAIVTWHSREVGIALLALTVILLLTGYVFRPTPRHTPRPAPHTPRPTARLPRPTSPTGPPDGPGSGAPSARP